jgi:hypothetical protein
MAFLFAQFAEKYDCTDFIANYKGIERAESADRDPHDSGRTHQLNEDSFDENAFDNDCGACRHGQRVCR